MPELWQDFKSQHFVRHFFHHLELKIKDKHHIVSLNHTNIKIPLVFVTLLEHMVISLNKYQEANGDLPSKSQGIQWQN